MSVKSEPLKSEYCQSRESNMNIQFGSVGLPTFDGSGSVKRFLDDFERFSRLQNWDDAKKLDVFPLCLVGIARDAFDALGDDQKATFAGVKSGLINSFSSRSSVDHHVALRALKFDPSGSLDAFVIEFRKLVALAFPGQPLEGLLYNHFLSTLPAEFYSAIIADGISTFEDAVTKVRNICSAARHAPQSVRHMTSATRAPDDSLVAQLERRIAELEARVESGAAGGQPRRSRECYACGKQGHMRFQCEHKNATCSKCSRRGHLSAVCGKYQGNFRGFTRRATGGPEQAQAQ